MDDWQIMMIGGDDNDIKEYANAHGADLTKQDIDDDNDWAYDRHKDEEVSDYFAGLNTDLPADERNVY